MSVERIVADANCYLLDCPEGGVCVIDPGRATLLPADIHVRVILLTHGHFDHSGGAERLRKTTGAPVYVSVPDAPMLRSAEASFAEWFGELYDPVTEFQTFSGGETLRFGGRSFEVFATPGHTAGSVCFLTEEGLFTGDTLFRGGIGRTDIGGNNEQMRASLLALKNFPGNPVLYPGHGDKSTLEEERLYNPYLVAVK